MAEPESTLDHEIVSPSLDDLLQNPSWARVHNFLLGGEAHWAIDRDFARGLLHQFPMERGTAFRQQQFLQRSVRYMAEQGIRQFVDIGSGIAPDAMRVHAVADAWSKEQGRQPDTRVTYVDNDPVVIGHGEVSLSESGSPERHAMLNGDLRQPFTLWDQIIENGNIDPAKPLGLLVVGTMQLAQSDVNGVEVGPQSLENLRGLMPGGSFMAVSHVTSETRVPGDSAATEVLEGIQRLYREAQVGNFVWRSRVDIEPLLGEFQPVGPGWVPAEEWGQQYASDPQPQSNHPVIWAAVGQKGDS